MVINAPHCDRNLERPAGARSEPDEILALFATSHRSAANILEFIDRPSKDQGNINVKRSKPNQRKSWKATAAGVLAMAGVAFATPSIGDAQGNMFGVVSHFMFTDAFFRDYSPYWSLQYTLPVMQDLGVGWAHEALFAYTAPERMLVVAGSAYPNADKIVERHRQLVDESFAQYDASAIRVVLAVVAARPSSKNAAAINAEFADWIAQVVAKHPSIVAVQLHNEPNLKQLGNLTPEEYVSVFRPFAARIKEAQPRAEILVGAVSSLWWPQAMQWFERAAQAGMLDFADGVAVHPYNTRQPPEVDPFFSGATKTDPRNNEKAIEAYWRRVSTLNKSGRPLKLYFTEYGYSTSPSGLGAVGSEERQADWLSRLVLIYQDLRLRGVPLEAPFWYDLKDDGQDANKEQHRYGLITFDLGRRKPAFDALKAVTHFFSDIGDLEPVDNVKATAGDYSDSVKIFTWRRKSDSALIVAFWRLDQVAEPPTDFNSTLQITPPVGTQVRRAAIYTADGRPFRSTSFTSDNGTISIPATVSARASWIVLNQ